MPQLDADRTAALEAKVASLRGLLAELAQDKATLLSALTAERRRYDELVERAPWLVARVGSGLRYLDANRHFRELLGHVPIVDRPVGSCGEGEEVDAAIRAFCADTEATHREVEVRIAQRDGDHQFLLLLSRSAFEQHVSVLGVDQSALRQALAQAEASADRAREANRAKTHFLAVMSHEIRTPLTGILGMAELLLDGELSGDDRRVAEQIDQSGVALLRVVNDILDLTKIEAQRFTLEAIPLAPRDVARSVHGLYAQQARAGGVALQTVVLDDVPDHVIGDPTRLTQVLANVTSNAVKFTSSGAVTIRLGYRDGWLHLAVQDTGVGLGEDKLEQVFEPFVQAERSTSRRYGGTGLGLSIARQLVEAMGGEIRIESELGVGTTVSFSLPARAVACAPSGAGFDRERELMARLAELAPDVLIVEDHPVNQAIARRMLESAGCRVGVASDGRAGVNAVRKGSFDLVFMDVNMPVLDGLAAVRAIRALPSPLRSIPVIAMTANAIEGDRDACLAAGMDDYVGKPFRRLDLIEAIVRQVRLRRAS